MILWWVSQRRILRFIFLCLWFVHDHHDGDSDVDEKAKEGSITFSFCLTSSFKSWTILNTASGFANFKAFCALPLDQTSPPQFELSYLGLYKTSRLHCSPHTEHYPLPVCNVIPSNSSSQHLFLYMYFFAEMPHISICNFCQNATHLFLLN